MLGTDELYKLLYRHMGPQNWWPADNDIELMLGAILVQNTRLLLYLIYENDFT